MSKIDDYFNNKYGTGVSSSSIPTSSNPIDDYFANKYSKTETPTNQVPAVTNESPTFRMNDEQLANFRKSMSGYQEIGTKVKLPIVGGGATLPQNNIVSSLTKAGVEFPEKAVRSLSEMFGISKNTEERRAKEYQTESYAESGATATGQIYDTTGAKGASVILGSLLASGEFANDALLFSAPLSKAAKSTALEEKLFKDLVVKYKMPKTIYFNSAQVKDVWQTGKLLTEAEKTDLLQAIGGNRTTRMNALKNGITIEIPSEKIVTLQDKPYWAKIKKYFGVESTPNVISKTPRNVKETVRGYLEEGKSPVDEYFTKKYNLTTESAPLKPVGYSKTAEIVSKTSAKTYPTEILDPDRLKKLANDYNPANAEKYSKQTFENYKQKLEERSTLPTGSPYKKVVLLSGGPGSGKSDFLITRLEKSGAIIYDAPNLNPDSVREKIKLARDKGFDIEIHGVLADPVTARHFQLQREFKTGRSIPLDFSAESHAKFSNTMLELLKDGENVFIRDTRGLTSRDDILKTEFVDNPIDLLKNTRYTKEEIYELQKYVKFNPNNKTIPTTRDARTKSGTLSVSSRRGANKGQPTYDSRGSTKVLQGESKKVNGKTNDKSNRYKEIPQGKEILGTNRAGTIGGISKDSGPNIRGLVKHIKNNPDGFTLKLNGEPISKGFVVSPFKGREAILKNIDAKLMRDFILKNIDLLEKDNHYFGGWKNKEDGNFYLDVSVVSDNLDSAMKVAIDNNQIAIYDLNAGKELFTKDYIPTNTQLKSSVFERMKVENPNLEGNLGYDELKMKADTEKAIDLISKDKQLAYDIAMGKEISNEVTSTAVNIALTEKALQEGNHELASKLITNRSLAQTRRGQEIVAEKGSITDNSTQRYVKELISTRLDKFGSKYTQGLKGKTSKAKASELIDNEVTRLEKQIKGKKIDMKTALNLLDKLECI